MSIDGHPVVCWFCSTIIEGPDTADALERHTEERHPGETPTYSAWALD